MSLKEQITDDMKDAMRAKDRVRLDTIRMLMAGIKQREVDERKELSGSEVLGVIEKMIKQRRDSITQFEAGGRKDLADREQAELDVLLAYMPAALGQEELEAEVLLSVAGASGMQDMGKVMAELKTRLAGRADMSVVSAMVREALSRV